jgi:uncharacterized protein (DUF1697 family)
MLEPDMAVIVSMLRGVNVGGHNMIKMDALRALYQSLKLRDPETYVQSGNVVFRTDERDLVLLARRIENGIERRFQFRPDVIVRTTSELRDVIARNPFALRRDIEPSKLLVTFLASDPDSEAREKILKIKTDPEELSIGGREVYIYYPTGMGRSKLSWMAIANALKTTGTGRNWNSVTKLLEIVSHDARPHGLEFGSPVKKWSWGILDRVKQELRIRFAKRGAVAYHNHSNFYSFTYVWDTLRQRGAVQMLMSITSKGAI